MAPVRFYFTFSLKEGAFTKILSFSKAHRYSPTSGKKLPLVSLSLQTPSAQGPNSGLQSHIRPKNTHWQKFAAALLRHSIFENKEEDQHGGSSRSED
jgi:hypothetical protein